MSWQTNRRGFLKAAALPAAGWIILTSGRSARSYQANEKLNVAVVGIGRRGSWHVSIVPRVGQNLVALCDANHKKAAEVFKKHPDVPKYFDFRKMLDELDQQIDALVVATPDHTHAVACMDAIRRGKHVYCEKPLAHSIYEIRELMKAARKHKVVTQLGNQGHSSDHIRLFCEWIWDGAIGNVYEVHAGCTADHCKISQLSKRSEKHDVPPELDWNLWLTYLIG